MFLGTSLTGRQQTHHFGVAVSEVGRLECAADRGVVAWVQPQSQTLGASRRNDHLGTCVPCKCVAVQAAPVPLSGFAKQRRYLLVKGVKSADPPDRASIVASDQAALPP